MADPAVAVAGLDAGLLDTVIPLTVLILLALLVPAGMLAASWLAHRSKSSAPTKSDPYECGLRATLGTADDRFSIKFYLVAMLFLVFDLEVAFLYPWAVHFNDGGWGMVGVLLVFLVILEAGYLYLWRKGALDWDK
ncbi:MAG: NADH-quinone oxidoreductase subunit A [Planctomycetota bacterium]